MKKNLTLKKTFLLLIKIKIKNKIITWAIDLNLNNKKNLQVIFIILEHIYMFVTLPLRLFFSKIFACCHVRLKMKKNHFIDFCFSVAITNLAVNFE